MTWTLLDSIRKSEGVSFSTVPLEPQRPEVPFPCERFDVLFRAPNPAGRDDDLVALSFHTTRKGLVEMLETGRLPAWLVKAATEPMEENVAKA